MEIIKKYKFKELILLVLLLMTLQAHANVIIDTKEIKLTDFSMSYYDDVIGLNYEEVRKKEFTASSNKISRGIKNKFTWVKIIVTNQTTMPVELFIHHPYMHHYKKLFIYEEEENLLINKIKIDMENFHENRYVYGGHGIHKLYLEAKQTKTLYLKLEFYSYSWFTIMIYDDFFSKKALTDSHIDISLLVGALLILAIYNILFYFGSKRKENLYYSLYLFFASSWIALSYGLLSVVFNVYGNIYFKLNYSIMLMPIFLILFIMEIFQTKTQYKKEHIFLQSVIFLITLNMLYGLYDFNVAMKLSSLLAVYTMLTTMFTSLSFYRKKNKTAKYFILGHTFFIIFNILAVLYYRGLIENYYITSHGVGIGITIEAIMLSFIISYRIKLLELKDKEFKKTLRLKVQERTKELETQKYKAQEATRTKSSFLANMSHEIRTPISGIIGMVHLALQNNKDKQQESYLKNIDLSATSLLSIINDILDFSKIEAGKLDIEKVDFNLYDLVNHVKNMMMFRAKEKSLFFDIIYDKNINFYLYGDSLRIGQVLINLLSNAIKFTNKGSVKLIISNQNDKFRFEIIDTGIGLTSKEQSKLFKSFSQVDGSITRKYGGTGLGLSISKQLIELMGGKIWLESEVNKGSSFIFEIVLPKGEKSNIKKKKIEKQDMSVLKGREILLLEDNFINQEIIVGLLEHHGLKIDIANNGEEGIQKFKNKHYELILMDLQMPIMDGYEATTIIRKLGSLVPIIALSANAMQTDIEKTKTVGMNEHLNKPIDIDKLNETLLKYLSKNVDSVVNKEEINKLEIPSLKHIDVEVGLSYMGENRELYLRVLNNFRVQYKNLKLEILSQEELQITLHTIKGLSANIGAKNLHEIVKKLDEKLDESLLNEFYEKINFVIDELDHNLYINQIENNNDRELISDETQANLFLELEVILKTARPKNIQAILKKIKKVKLNDSNMKLFLKVEELVGAYKFKEALEKMRM